MSDWRFMLDDTAMEVGLGTRPMAMPECSIPERERKEFEDIAETASTFWKVHIVGEQGKDGSTFPLVCKNKTVAAMYFKAKSLEDKAMMHAFIGLLLGYAPDNIEEFVHRFREGGRE